jgi:hypothetical protein
MSTDLKTIIGSKHEIVDNTFDVIHIEEELLLNTFWNGKLRGKSLQLTIGNEYIHLTIDQCKELIDVITSGILT